MATTPRKSGTGTKRSVAQRGNKNGRGNSGGGGGGGGNRGLNIEPQELMWSKPQTRNYNKMFQTLWPFVNEFKSDLEKHNRIHGLPELELQNTFTMTGNRGRGTQTGTKRTAAKRGTGTRARATGGRNQQQERTTATG
jgi:hypothetical protein